MASQFNQRQFDENDLRAREKAKEILSKRFEVIDNTNQYGVDLICKRNGRIRYYVEVEVKNLWKGSSFPWGDINVPIRKEKFFKEHDNVLYIMFNSDLTSCFIMTNKTILESPKKEVPNTRNLIGEKFFKVPYSKIIHHKNI